jgi:uncharacterized protein (DUF302 family)
MAGPDVPYGYTRTFPKLSFDEAVRKTTEALKAEGFGVLTTIDVRETLKQKLGADFRRYLILGACNPQLAHRALGADLGVGLLLPCNVTVYEADDGTTVVQVVKPAAMLEVAKRPELQVIAREADQRLSRALAAI